MARNKQTKKSISIGYRELGQGVNDGMGVNNGMEVKLPDELLKKITESLALSIARKIVADSAEALQTAEVA